MWAIITNFTHTPGDFYLTSLSVIFHRLIDYLYLTLLTHFRMFVTLLAYGSYDNYNGLDYKNFVLTINTYPYTYLA